MGNYDKLTDSIAAGRQAMHDCMGVVYQNKKTNEASAPPELAATHNRDTGTGAFHSQQLLARDQAAVDSMVLPSSAVSRLPWRRDGTISLSRLASDITAPIFSDNNMFLFSHKGFLYF